jgi:glycosyltransferase involved in cell wall biosynthesis
MDCSTVISVCNEVPHIYYTIQSIIEGLDETYEQEIIVVDNLSTDGLEQHFRENPVNNVRYVKYSDKRSHWNAKNVGIKEAKSRNIFFIDGHCIIGRNSLKNLIDFSDNFNGNLGGVHCLHHYIGDNSREFEHRCRSAKFIYGFRRSQGFKEPYQVAHMSTCGMMVRKKTFDELGGWNKMLGVRWGGESYINLKHGTCGYPHYIHPKAHYYHYKHKYAYGFDGRNGYTNLMIPAYTVGGDEWLKFQTDHIIEKKGEVQRPCIYDRMADEVRNVCKEDRDFIASKQIMTLTEYYKKWGIV